jgi:hypothetical protein
MSTLIFDCDGVLADTERYGHLPSFNQTFEEFGLPFRWSEEEYGRKLAIGGGKERMSSMLTPEVIRENMEFRMRDFGMCSPTRNMRMKDFLTYGVSELLAMAVTNQTLDAAVLVADGAGTVVVSDPELIQGIGGRISGVIETTPIAEVIEAVGRVVSEQEPRLTQTGEEKSSPPLASVA